MIYRLESLLADASLPPSRFLNVTQRSPVSGLMREVISPSNVISPGARSSS